MKKSHCNKKILITGATGGIGLSLCDYLAQKGYDLILIGRMALYIVIASFNILHTMEK